MRLDQNAVLAATEPDVWLFVLTRFLRANR
jgi:hypothetical protein